MVRLQRCPSCKRDLKPRTYRDHAHKRKEKLARVEAEIQHLETIIRTAGRNNFRPAQNVDDDSDSDIDQDFPHHGSPSLSQIKAMDDHRPTNSALDLNVVDPEDPQLNADNNEDESESQESQFELASLSNPPNSQPNPSLTEDWLEDELEAAIRDDLYAFQAPEDESDVEDGINEVDRLEAEEVLRDWLGDQWRQEIADFGERLGLALPNTTFTYLDHHRVRKTHRSRHGQHQSFRSSP